MRFMSTMGWSGYDATKNIVLTQMHADPSGKLYYPFMPWTAVMVLMNFFPVPVLAISIALLLICLNLLVSFGMSEPIIENDTKSKAVFNVIGIIFFACGLVINFHMLLLPNLGFFTVWQILNEVYTPMISASFFLLLGGLLAFGVADNVSLAKKFSLFIITTGLYSLILI